MATPTIESLSGIVDGANTIFETTYSYVSGSTQVWQDGQMLRKDYDDGWSELGTNRIRMAVAPKAGSVMQMYYLAIV